MRKKITGYMVVWNAQPFISPALEQAVNICDHVMIAVGPHSEHMKAHVDQTEQFVLAAKHKNPDKITIVPVQYRGSHSQTKGDTLKEMVRQSPLHEPNNWVWLLDADEFYLQNEAEDMREVIQDTECNSIECDEKYFFINTKKHLVNRRRRLYRITAKENTWKATSKWNAPKDIIHNHEGEGLFHYSALMDPVSKKAFWATEYQSQFNTVHPLVKWMDEIYLKFELENEDYWLDRNQQLFGVRTHFWIGDIYPGPDGKLVDYLGPHPEPIETAGLTDIPDFRKIYTP